MESFWQWRIIATLVLCMFSSIGEMSFVSLDNGHQGEENKDLCVRKGESWYQYDNLYCCPCSVCNYGSRNRNYFEKDCYDNVESSAKKLYCSPPNVDECINIDDFVLTTQKPFIPTTPVKNVSLPLNSVFSETHVESSFQNIIIIFSVVLVLLLIIVLACCCSVKPNKYHPKQWLKVCVRNNSSDAESSKDMVTTDLSSSDCNEENSIIGNDVDKNGTKQAEDEPRITHIVTALPEEYNENLLRGGRDDPSRSIPPEYSKSDRRTDHPYSNQANAHPTNSFLSPTQFHPSNHPPSYPHYGPHYPYSQPVYGESPSGYPYYPPYNFHPMMGNVPPATIPAQPGSNNLVLNNVNVYGSLNIKHGQAGSTSSLNPSREAPRTNLTPSSFTPSQLQRGDSASERKKTFDVDSRPVRMAKNDYDEVVSRHGNTMRSSSENSHPAAPNSAANLINSGLIDDSRHIAAPVTNPTDSCSPSEQSSARIQSPSFFSETHVKNCDSTSQLDTVQPRNESSSLVRSSEVADLGNQLSNPIQETTANARTALLDSDFDLETSLDIYQPSKDSDAY